MLLIVSSDLWDDFDLYDLNFVNKLSKHYRRYSRGEHKFVRDLSVIQFIKMQHNLKLLVSLLFNKRERLIASFQKNNRISNSSDSIYSYSDNSVDRGIPSMLDNKEAKQTHWETIDKFFEEYLQQKLSSYSFKLLHKMYSNKESTFTQFEELKENENLSEFNHQIKQN